MFWVIVLAVLGVALVIAEVFFPSMGVLSIIAGVCLVSSVMLGFQEGDVTGILVLASAVVAVPAAVIFALRWLPRTALGKNLVLDTDAITSGKSGGQEPGLEALVGRRGRSTSPLRPAGIARIDGRRIDVVSRGEPIDANTPVIVVEVEANRVVVKADASPSATSA